VTWLDCVRTEYPPDKVHALIGALEVYAYSPDRLKLTPNRPLLSGAELVLADCDGAEADMDSTYLGKAVFGGGEVPCNPCLPAEDNVNCDEVVPTLPVTWGKIKTLYR
jgi:hypothetical protein